MKEKKLAKGRSRLIQENFSSAKEWSIDGMDSRQKSWTQNQSTASRMPTTAIPVRYGRYKLISCQSINLQVQSNLLFLCISRQSHFTAGCSFVHCTIYSSAGGGHLTHLHVCYSHFLLHRSAVQIWMQQWKIIEINAYLPRTVIVEQESCAIAKMAAQCALHMSALKIFGTPWLRPQTLFPTFSWAFVPIDPMNVPTKFEVPGYAHAPFSPKFWMGFYLDWPCKCNRQIWSP